MLIKKEILKVPSFKEKSAERIYDNIKKYFKLNTLPNLSEEQLFYFCAMHNNVSCKKY